VATTVNNNAQITGKLRRQIYGWYDLTTFKWLEGEDLAKAGLRDLLSGKKDAVAISYTLSRPGQSWVSSSTDNWKRTGKATLTIEGRAVEVVTLQNDAAGTAGSNFASHYDLWYDPASHLFVKAHQVATGGDAKSNDSEVTSLLVP